MCSLKGELLSSRDSLQVISFNIWGQKAIDLFGSFVIQVVQSSLSYYNWAYSVCLSGLWLVKYDGHSILVTRHGIRWVVIGRNEIRLFMIYRIWEDFVIGQNETGYDVFGQKRMKFFEKKWADFGRMWKDVRRRYAL